MSENISLNAAYEAASGQVRYNMTNDYMFRAVLQKNNYVLKGLISSLLHIPIKGEDYISIKPVIHIGFLDFPLTGRTPEFYSTYKLINVKNHEVYSDNITLSVVDLNQIELATKEDKAYHIDYWASLFKADSWEVIKMLAEKDNYIKEASKTIFELSSDEMIQKQCRDREEYYLDKRAMERIMEEQKAQLAEKDSRLSKQSMQLAEKDSQLSQQSEQLAKKDNQITAQANEIAELKAQLAKLQK